MAGDLRQLGMLRVRASRCTQASSTKGSTGLDSNTTLSMFGELLMLSTTENVITENHDITWMQRLFWCPARALVPLFSSRMCENVHLQMSAKQHQQSNENINNQSSKNASV